jgi:F-type H+-transporting ATPase subunit delta
VLRGHREGEGPQSRGVFRGPFGSYPRLASKSGDTGVATRYALALFELADEKRKLDDVARDLRALDAMIDESSDLKRLLRNPVVSRAESGRAMAAILDSADADALTRNFIGLVAANRRLFALPEMISAFLSELAQRRGEVTAEVTSAQELTDAQAKSLEDALRTAVGGKVALSLKVNPGLVGGLVVKVGSRMIDSSLKSQLARLKLAMKGAA